MTDNGRMNVAVGLDNSRLRSDAAESQNILRSIARTAEQEGARMENSLLKVGKVIGTAFAVSKLKDFAAQVVSIRGQIQSLEISFRTLAGETAGDKLFQGIKEFAVKTPMMMKDLAAGAQTMLAFNIEAEKIMPLLQAIGDISMGDAAKFNSLTLAFSQMSATGKLMGQDLLQMINAGFNPLSVIAEKTGKTIGELKEQMEAGKITTEMVTEAFIAATSEGGKFHNMLEQQSQGIQGSISNLQGAIDDMMNEIGTATEGTMVSVINAATSLAKNYEQVGRVLMGLIATYGTYKAALIAVTACKGWATAAEALHYNWLLLVEKAQRMLNATMLNNPYVLVATLIAGVAAAMFSLKTEAEKLKEKEEEYEEQKQKVIEAEQKHKEEIEKLCSVSEDEAVSTDVRREALHKLEQKYPDIFAKYKTETEMLENIKRIKQEIAELDGKKSITNPKNELAQVNSRIAQLEAKAATLHEEWEDANGSGTRMKKVKKGGLTLDEQLDLIALKKKRAQLQGQAKKADTDAYFANLTGISNDELRRQIKIRKDLLAKMEIAGTTHGKIVSNDLPHAGTYTKEELQAQLQQLQRQQSYRDAESKSGAQWVADKKKAYTDALKAYNDYVNGVTSKGVKEEDFKRKSEELKSDMEAKKKAYEKVKPATDSEASKKARDAKKAQDEANRIAVQTAERTQKIEKYADAVVQAQKEAEFEIEQNEINLLDEGVEKQLRQIDLNYRRLTYENEKRQAEMVEELRNKKALEWENANPTAKKNGQTFDRSSVTAADLSDEQKAMLKEYARIAGEIRTKGEKDAMKQMLEDVMTYEQQRLKVSEDYAKKREQLYDHDEKGNRTGLKKGVTEGNVSELDRQEQEALKAVDEQFASREEEYKAWCDAIGELTLKQLQDLLEKAKSELAALKKQGASNEALATARAKVNKLDNAVKSANAKDKLAPKKRTIKEWQDLYSTLNECAGAFDDIGDAVGGATGEILKAAGQISTSTLSMINGIVTLVNSSGTAMQGTAAAASTAIQTVEKASVILTVISAALQVATAIANLFNNDESKQEEIERLQERIDQLQWELDNADTMRLNKEYGSSVERVRKAMLETRMELVNIALATGNWYSLMTACYGKLSKNTVALGKTVKALADQYEKMSYTADKALGDARYDDYYKQLENISQQQILIQEQIGNEKDKKKTDWGQITEWERKIEELGQQAVAIINDMLEDIIGGSAVQISEQLSDAFFDAFANGEDAAEAWGNKVKEICSDIVKRMLVQKMLEPEIGKIFDKYKAQWFKDGKFVGAEEVKNSMGSFMADLMATQDVMTQIWDAIPEELKQFLTGDTEREGVQKGIAAASQDSVDELNARATTIQSHTYSISENTKLLVANTNAILSSVSAIEAHTEAMSTKLESVERSVKSMRDTLDDFNTQGMKLKK